MPDVLPQRVPSAPSDAEKYLYLGAQNRWLLPVQGLAFLGVALSLGRFALHVRGAQLFLLVLALQAVGLAVSLRASTRRRRVDPSEHRALVDGWRPEHVPSVDVLLPTAGEPLEVLANTYWHVARLMWDGDLRAYVLDDADRPEVRELAGQHGFEYVVRPDRGRFKKAGNLLHAFHRTSGDLILVLDADFAPRADFLDELVPYFDDPTVGIVQSPQFFDASPDMTWLERTAGATQELFYRFVQPSRDAVDAAICVGTNAIYRRVALEQAGGFAQIEHSEDVHTGVKLLGAGYRTRYVPVIVAKGLCPDDFRGFVNQQYRWCSGSMSLLRGWSQVGGRLDWKQRLCFWSGFLYYIGTATAVFTSLLPALLMLWLTPEHVHPRNYLPLFGGMVVWFVLLPRVLAGGWRLEVLRVQMLYSYAHAVAIVDMLRDTTHGWVATGAVRTATPLVDKVRRTTLTYAGVLQVLLWVGLLRGALQYGVDQYWVAFVFAAVNAYITWPVMALAWRSGVRGGSKALAFGRLQVAAATGLAADLVATVLGVGPLGAAAVGLWFVAAGAFLPVGTDAVMERWDLDA